MSRTIIAAVVAAVIGALTAIAFFVTSSSTSERSRKDAEAQVSRAHAVVQQLNQLGMIDVRNKAERLAARPEFANAIAAENQQRKALADEGFRSLSGDEKQRGGVPDIMALVDKDGRILAMYDGNFVPDQWIAEGKKSVIPPLDYVLTKADRSIILSDVWTTKDGMKRAGVAPVVSASGDVIGAIVVTYPQTAANAQADRGMLGTEIGYFDKSGADAFRVQSSFTKGATTEEDTAKSSALGKVLDAEESERLDLEKQHPELKLPDRPSTAQIEARNKVAETARTRHDELLGSSRRRINVDGTEYSAMHVRMPRSATRDLPGYFPGNAPGAIVLQPIADTAGSNAKWFILLLGGGALAISLLGLYLSHRRLIAQIDAVELGVIDIINGNIDRTFRSVGPELDGLANGLNVMLARLLGRPEPGEEEFDDEGNPIIPGRVEFDEGDERPAPDPDLAALAQESEPDYYKRVFTEYQQARKAAGTPDDGSFENFIAKLKVNEGKLKAQYQCRAVRFRVVTKDGKVSLKPVPIFA